MKNLLVALLFAVFVSFALAGATTPTSHAVTAQSGLSVFDIGASLPPAELIQPRLVSAVGDKRAPAPAPTKQRQKPGGSGAKPMDDCAEDEGGGDCVHGPNFPPDGDGPYNCHVIWVYGVPVIICQ